MRLVSATVKATLSTRHGWSARQCSFSQARASHETRWSFSPSTASSGPP
nr:hypothetical protein [Glycomyces arizonensis]